jgi:catechol-2,3-dioxygenase
MSLPATLRLGAVHLIVADLDRAVAWYQRSRERSAASSMPLPSASGR